ncbi:MAG: AAA family ATPase [Bradyrhizobium sp.]|uniref:AAA family ATPase n=1 Tax=Bradyrhizobium sp. TaxID=376 RepID=UPI0029B30511|nr:AAA family ATPase [Bradyrhizobium sp.]MDX3965508.1 AAA family ATPase [Bradyrhizobium sp.]
MTTSIRNSIRPDATLKAASMFDLQPDEASMQHQTAVGPLASMGPFELSYYRRAWRDSFRFRQRIEEDAAARALRTAAVAPRIGFASLRSAAAHANFDDEESPTPRSLRSPSYPDARPVAPLRVAAALTLARLFDRRPGLFEAMRSRAPVVIVDVADPLMLQHVCSSWSLALSMDPDRLLDIDGDRHRRREQLDALYLMLKEPPKGASKSAIEKAAFGALALALPFVAISPMASTHLPAVLVAAASERIEFPALDAATIARTIRIVTGRQLRHEPEPDLVGRATPTDMAIAIRFDRTPAECMQELRRLVAARTLQPQGRDLRLSELHGLGEARRWAEAAIADIKAWKAGTISWSAVGSAVALNGPPGCGKTTFAAAFAREAGLHLVSATLAQWQSSGDGHLGHLLRAMRKDFEEARAKAPSCMFIDEVDSFPVRGDLTHSHKDYVIEVVNALLAEIDGTKGREGVVVIGASNDIRRCDPALLRAGRLEKIVNIGLPDVDELERMFRVRLANNLADEDLKPLAESALGMVGADIERIVKDALGAARRDGGRAITLHDLLRAFGGDDDRSEEELWRTCAHEAAHILVDVLHFGPENVRATTMAGGRRGGMSARSNISQFRGTPDHYRKRLQIVLAGREGEEMLLGSVSHGAGGMAGSDLEAATTIAAAMVGSLGLAGRSRLIYFGPKRSAGEFLHFPEVREEVARQLESAAVASRAMLEENRDALEEAARQLQRDGRIDGDEVARIIEANRVPTRI